MSAAAPAGDDSPCGLIASFKKKLASAEVKSLDVIRFTHKFSLNLIYPERLSADKKNAVNLLLAKVWPFTQDTNEESPRQGRREVLILFLLGLFKTWLMNHSSLLSKALVTTVFQRNHSQFSDLLRRCFVLSIVGSLANSWYRYSEEMLAVQWRATLTQYIHKLYFSKSNYYHISNKTGREAIQAPDNQIVSEIFSITKRLVSLVSALASALPAIAWFTYKLARERGVRVAVLPHLYLMLAYEIAQRLFPKNLSTLYKIQAQKAGEFSQATARVQSHSEAIAALQGAKREEDIVDKKFCDVVKAGRDVHTAFGKFQLIFKLFYVCGSRTWMAAMVMLPGLLNKAKLLTGSTTTAEVAGVQYTMTLMLEMLIANGKLLTMHAQSQHMFGLCLRINKLIATLQGLEKEHGENNSSHIVAGPSIRFDGVQVATPSGRTLVKDLSWELQPGGSLLLTGHNGAGKSSIFRCLGGLWPIKGGTITKPGAGRPPAENLKDIFYVPQKPYLTLGSLADQITYPLSKCEAQLSTVDLHKLLDLVHLGHLKSVAAASEGEELMQWEDKLSRGEQQCLAIARLLYHKPTFAILDECTSAVSREMEELLYNECERQGISYITICHRPTLRAFHDRNLNLTGADPPYEMKEIPASLRNAKKNEQAAAEQQDPLDSGFEQHYHQAVLGEMQDFASQRKAAVLAQQREAPELTDDCVVEIKDETYKPKDSISKRSSYNKITTLLGIMLPQSGMQLGALLSAIALRTCCHEVSSWVMGGMFKEMLRRDTRRFISFVALNALVVLFEGLTEEASAYMQNYISLSWSSNLSKHLRKKFFSHLAFYKLHNLDKRIPDADARLTQEINDLTTEFSEVWAKCLVPVVDVCWFTSRMQGLVGWSGMVPFYSYVAASGLLLKYCLPDFEQLNSTERELDAKFRFVHRRLVDHKESVAFFGGDDMEAAIANRELQRLISHMSLSRYRNAQYRTVAHVVSKDQEAYSSVVSLEDLVCARIQMQLEGDATGDFASKVEYVRSVSTRTIQAFSKLFSLSETLASLLGSSTRICELLDVMDSLHPARQGEQTPASSPSSATSKGNSSAIDMKNVSIVTPGPSDKSLCLVKDLSLHLEKGSSLMVTGRNATGKSALFRVLAGLWPLPPVLGEVSCPASIMLVPQRPYFVLGSLADQVTYPEPCSALIEKQGVEDVEKALRKALDLAGIGYLVEQYEGWDKEKRWQDVLSGGEQQRMGLARIFFGQPDFAVLDECTDAVNVEAEEGLYRNLAAEGITCITISKRLTLHEFHPEELRLGHDSLNGWELLKVAGGGEAELSD